MARNKYMIMYLPSFSEELNEIIYYITYILKNKKAAERLLEKVRKAIEKRSESPESYKNYVSKKNMKYDWYRSYVGNFTIFYVVRKNIMEIAHIIYSKRNLDELI